MPPQEPWTVKRLLTSTTEYLTGRGIESARLCAEMLVGHVLDLSRVELYTHFEDQPTDAQRAKLRELVRRAGTNEPVQYLVENAGFFGFEVKVTPAVLIPRPDTETLIDAVVRRCVAEGRKDEALRIADVCTGSGIIAIALAKSLPQATVVATDVSPEATAVATENVQKHGLDERIEVRVGDLLEPLDEEMFDVVATNPPYIPSAAVDELDANVRDFEPRLALDGGSDGLEILRRLLAGADARLKEKGWLVAEMQHDQGPALVELATSSGWASAKVLKDLARRDRVLEVTRGD